MGGGAKVNFITLTDFNNEKVRINFNHIESYGVITTKNYNFNDQHMNWDGFTFLCPAGISDADGIYVVKETPDQIDRMLNPRKDYLYEREY